ncbi:hypothetical protein LCGC14_3127880, partial [marine sediment metagenome]
INHNGNVGVAKSIIALAKNFGADFVKFQKRTVDVVYTEAQLEAWGVKYHELQINTKPYYDFWVDDKAMSVEDWDRRHASMKVDELSEYDDVVGDPDAV